MYRVQTSERRGPREAVQLVPLHGARHEGLLAAAAADGHAVIEPSHVILRGAEAVGYVSLGVVPMFFAWVDSKKLSAPETFRAWRAAEEILQAKRAGQVCLPCEARSPLLPYIERMGYRKIGDARLHLKGF